MADARPNISASIRHDLESLIEDAINLLDALDPDPELEETGDLEPSLGAYCGMHVDAELDDSDSEDGGDDEPEADHEPNLGAPEAGDGPNRGWWESADGSNTERELQDHLTPMVPRRPRRSVRDMVDAEIGEMNRIAAFIDSRCHRLIEAEGRP